VNRRIVASVSVFPAIFLWCGSIGLPQEPSLKIEAPTEVMVHSHLPADLVLNVSGADSVSPLCVGAIGLPAGLVGVQGTPDAERTRLRVYGIVSESVKTDSVYRVTWYAKNGTFTRYAYSALHIEASPDTEDFEHRVEDLVTTGYFHGMPELEAHRLGSRALPLLAKMLREDKHKIAWTQIAGAIGFIGDTSSFDTIRTFIWARFKGPIDLCTFMAIREAQSSLSAIATTSPRALAYLVHYAQADSWKSIPWSVPGEGYTRESICEMMANETVIALGYTDLEGAGEALRALSPTARNPAFLMGALHVHARVRAVGFPQVWAHGVH